MFRWRCHAAAMLRRLRQRSSRRGRRKSATLETLPARDCGLRETVRREVVLIA
jgi:hypothetical protein